MNQQEHPPGTSAGEDREPPKPSEKYRPPTRSLRKRVRVRKEDSAFLYNILESYEGIAAYSTLDHRNGALHRDIELFIPPEFLEDVELLLKRLGDLTYAIDSRD